ncbi:MAG TPA: hypothetical protein VF469_41370 [Kofleriaceae bacterium]
MRTGRGITEPRVLVHYAGIRREIRDGDILLFRGKSWLSRIICRVTGSPYSHAAIVAWWNERLMMLEAVGKGIVVSRMSVVVNTYSGKVELWTTDEDLGRAEVILAAQRLLGKRYSPYKLIRNLERLVFGRPRHEEADPEAPPGDFVCSEFVSRVWRAGGIDLVGDSPDMYTKPSDIARSPHLRKVGGVVRGQSAKLTGDSLDRIPTSAAGAQ